MKKCTKFCNQRGVFFRLAMVRLIYAAILSIESKMAFYFISPVSFAVRNHAVVVLRLIGKVNA